MGVETVEMNKVDASSMTHIHVDVWSPDFTQFSLKLVDFAASGNTEHQVDYFTPNQGEWIGYDIPLSNFTGLVNRSDIAQYIFVGRPVGVNTIFIDNIYFYDDGSGGGGGGDCPPPTGDELATNGDFEVTDTDCGWELFSNGGTAMYDNSLNNGGSSSGKLMISAPGNPGLKQNFLGAGVVSAGDVVQIQFDHIGSVTPPGALFNVLLFGEQAGDGASFTEIFDSITLSGSWTTYTTTFTIPAVDVSQGISVLIQAVCGGDAGCSVTANIDNFSVTLNP